MPTYVVMSGSRQLAWIKGKSKKKVDSVLAKEYKKQHNVRVGRLRPARRKKR